MYITTFLKPVNTIVIASLITPIKFTSRTYPKESLLTNSILQPTQRSPSLEDRISQRGQNFHILSYDTEKKHQSSIFTYKFYRYAIRFGAIAGIVAAMKITLLRSIRKGLILVVVKDDLNRISGKKCNFY